MARFLIDEDLPRSLAEALRRPGLDARDVRDVGLRGHSDEAIFEFAVAQAMVVVTADVDFGNVLRFPQDRHHGIVVARFPNETPIAELNAAVVAAIESLRTSDLEGAVVVIEPMRIRVRKR